MSVDAMRDFLRGRYGASWMSKVDKMSDAQVIAVYHRIISRKKEN